jgi:hypothetical protein
MATYTRSDVEIPGGLLWADVTQLSVLSTSSTVLRLLNTDGTITEVVSLPGCMTNADFLVI